MQQNQFQLYQNLPYSGDVSVYNFWKSHSIDLPDLYNIAKNYFGLYPSSACIERAFSMARDVLDDKFCAITPENAEKRIFLYINNDFIGENH